MLLLSILFVSNISLGLAYIYQRPNMSDFGKVPSYLRTYLVVSGFAGFVSLFLSSFGLSFFDPLSETKEAEASFFLSIYYGLQCVFFPISRRCLSDEESKRSAWETRYILLLITYCSCMYSYICILVHAPVWVITLSILNSCHSFVNDFILFGFLFC